MVSYVHRVDPGGFGRGRKQGWKAGGCPSHRAPGPRGWATPMDPAGRVSWAQCDLLTFGLVPGPLTGKPRELSSSMAPKT